MAYSAKLRSGSLVLLGICCCGWVLALGGLGAQNWLVCSNAEKTLKSIAEENPNGLSPPGPLPVKDQDVAFCSRSWKWEWWTLFFQFAVMMSAIAVTILPSRLPRARFPLANMLSIASVLIMVALNTNLTQVWAFYDQKVNFNEWAGVLRQLYMSAAALVAGWVIVVIMNLIWIGFALDTEVAAEGAAPITDPEAAAAARKN